MIQIISQQMNNAEYLVGQPAEELSVEYSANSSYTIKWQASDDGESWEDVQTKKIAEIPTVTANLTYNGTVQEPTIIGVDEDYVIIEGDTSGINAGDYNIIFKLRQPHAYWADGTIADKAFPWSIAKANATMTKPTAKTGLIAFGSAVTLVNAGSASGGTIYYGLGASTTSAPSSWSTSLPSGTGGTYYVWSKVVGDANHNDVEQSYACTVSVTAAKRVGGRIFYDDGDNGATYTFYDASGNVITDTSISGLANATGYVISGTPTKDRFYVYDNTSHTTGGISVVNGLAGEYEMYWDVNCVGRSGAIGITSDGIGLGKTNTATALAFASDWDNYDIWSYIKNCNSSNLNGCNDWFIASNAEQDKLIESGLLTWYVYEGLWSSVEIDRYTAYLCLSKRWECFDKDYFRFSCFAARAF